MQEAFVRVWDRWGRVGSMEDPVGYLYRTAMNAFRSARRRAVRAARRTIRSEARSDELSAVEDRDTAGQWRVEWFADDGRCELEIFTARMPGGRRCDTQCASTGISETCS